jgi:hypothetical protein
MRDIVIQRHRVFHACGHCTLIPFDQVDFVFELEGEVVQAHNVAAAEPAVDVDYRDIVMSVVVAKESCLVERLNVRLFEPGYRRVELVRAVDIVDIQVHVAEAAWGEVGAASLLAAGSVGNGYCHRILLRRAIPASGLAKAPSVSVPQCYLRKRVFEGPAMNPSHAPANYPAMARCRWAVSKLSTVCIVRFANAASHERNARTWGRSFWCLR